MLPRLITRRRLKWVGLVASVCLAAVMVASYWYWPRYVWSRANSSTTWYVSISNCGVLVARDSGAKQGLGKPLRSWSLPTRQAWKDLMLSLPGQVSYAPHAIQWLPTYTSVSQPPVIAQQVSVPIWMPLLLIAAPTAWLWFNDCRAKPWQCVKCRYDLRGLEGGVCPECGSGVGDSG